MQPTCDGDAIENKIPVDSHVENEVENKVNRKISNHWVYMGVEEEQYRQ